MPRIFLGHSRIFLKAVLSTVFTFLFGANVLGQSPGGVSTNLQLWLKGDVAVEEAAANPAEVGDNILNWLDQSGNTNDFTNDFGSAPTYAIIGGKRVIDFSQVASDYLRGPSVLSGNTARTVIIVCQPTGLSSSGANNCVFQVAPNEAAGRGYSLFLEDPVTTTGLACRVSGNRIMDHQSSTTLPSIYVVQNGTAENVSATDFYVSGTQITTQLSVAANTLNTSSIGTIIGGFSNNADNDPENIYDFNGYVSEIIVYDQELSNTDRNAIESYLNVRYGITIPVASHNYYSQAAYPEDIAGIGQNIITEGFSQDSSWSINPTSILTVNNPSSLDNGDYLVWGHDGGSNSSFVYTGIPVSVNFRMERIWRVSETGETGTQTLRFYMPGLNQCGTPLAASDFKLLVDNVDTDFSDAVSTDGTTYSNDTIYFTGVNLSDDDHFTIGIAGLERPGDVGDDLVLWLKADCGVEEAASDPAETGDNVLNWLDQSGNGSHVTNDIGIAPVFNTISGNEAVDFSGGSAYLRGPSVLSGTTARTFIVVGQPTSISNGTTNCLAALAPNNTAGTGYGMFWEQPGGSGVNGLAIRVSGNKVMDHTVSTSSVTFVQTSSGAGANVTATEFYSNGQLITQLESQGAAALNTNNLGVMVGGFSTGGDMIPESGFDFNGYVYEVIAYDREITCEERKQLDIYLADKYGVILDYFDETTTGSNGLITDIDGIIKKYSTYPDVTSFTSGDLTVSNVSYLTDVGDAFYAANNGSQGITASDVPVGIDRRLNRVWYGDYTSCNANTGNVTLSFDLSALPCNGFDAPANAANYRLLTSGTSSFAGATAISGATIVGNAIQFTVDITQVADLFFTIGTNDVSSSPLWWPFDGPANITSGLQLWLKADCGVEEAAGDPAEIGDPVLFWRDQSGQGNDVQNDIGGAPTFVTSSGSEGVDFGGGADYLRGPSVLSGTTGRTMIVVLNINSLAAGNGNAAVSLAPNNGGGTGYGLTFETPGGTNGMSIRVSGNKVMNYSVPTGQPVIVSVQTDDNENVLDTEFFVDGESAISVQSSSGNLLNTNTQGVTIGGWSTDGDFIPETLWDYDGVVYEVIVFDRELSCDEREQIEDYLSNKYSNTLYYYESENLGANGINTDPDSIYTANTSNASSAMTMTDVSTITDCIDSVYFAHDNGNGITFQVDDPNMSALVGTDVRRWTRVWYAIRISNETDPGNVTLTFDLDLYAASTTATVSGSDYILIDRTSSTPWVLTPLVSGPTINVGQNTVSFDVDVDEIHKHQFTLATLDNATSPLPIELLSFNAVLENRIVKLTWKTASETNNDFFTLEKSKDGISWESFKTVDGAGSSSSILNYEDYDQNPYSGVSYYRLKQTDFNGAFYLLNDQINQCPI